MNNEERLQKEIDDSMVKYDCASVTHIRLGPGSDVMNLHRNADVRAFVNSLEYREFSFLAKEFVEWVFSTPSEDDPRPDMADIYTTGGPLVIVAEITGDSIVRGVLRYLELEEGRGGV